MLLKNLGKTNCLTHIPEDIKLELNNGTLTLKAGSKVYVPNGKNADDSNKFDEIVFNKDVSRKISTSSVFSAIINYNYTDGTIGYNNISGCVSGTQAPNVGFFYNTDENTLRYYSNGVAGSTMYSLPIAIVSVSNGGFSSIDQVFNGFGYIGSTEFVLPGVKGLTPDGWDEGGRYKNIEYTVDNVLLGYSFDTSWTRDKQPIFISENGLITTGTGDDRYYTGNDRSFYDSLTYVRFYDTSKNLMYKSGATAGVWEQESVAFLGYASMSSGKITSLNINPVQTKHDYKNHILTHTEISDWTQPVLKSNGDIYGSRFACTESSYYTESDGREQRAWRLFSGDSTGEEWQINSVSTSSTYWVTFYNPNPLKISALQVQNGTGSFSPTKLVFQGSNDNSSWITLGTTNNNNTTTGDLWNATIDTTLWYKYYRIVVTPRSTTSLQVARLKITAQEKTVNRYLFARNGKFY